MNTETEAVDYEFVAGCYREVTPQDRAYRAGLAVGRTSPLAPKVSLHDALNEDFLRGYQAARWEVEGSCILG